VLELSTSAASELDYDDGHDKSISIRTSTSASHDEHEENNEDGWLVELKQRLINNPDAIVGEIGLDGARWRAVEEGNENDGNNSYNNNNNNNNNNANGNNPIWSRERILSCPMNLQRRAFEQQLLLAAELQRPVSIHVVRAWGELLDSFKAVQDAMKQKHLEEEEEARVVRNDEREGDCTRGKKKKKKRQKRLLMPPKIYFHAFSGKAGILSSLIAACEKGNVPREDVYFGFAPVRIPRFRLCIS